MRPRHRVRPSLVLACASRGSRSRRIGGGGLAPTPRRCRRSSRRDAAPWERLVHRPVFRPYSGAAGCRPLRAVFYAATDWLRLATTLAANASPCAQYFVSVPPVVADKTRQRPGAGGAHPGARAELPRPRGDPLHRLAEVGRQHRLDLVPGGRRGAAPDGRRGLRRGGRRHLGAQRGHLRGATRRREPRREPRASSCAGCTTRPARARRRSGVVFVVGHRPARRRGRDLQGAHAGVAPGLGVLERR